MGGNCLKGARAHPPQGEAVEVEVRWIWWGETGRMVSVVTS